MLKLESMFMTECSVCPVYGGVTPANPEDRSNITCITVHYRTYLTYLFVNHLKTYVIIEKPLNK